MKNKIKLNLLAIFFYFFLLNISQANFQEQLINKYKEINTLSFDFTQKIGDKIEIGNSSVKICNLSSEGVWVASGAHVS